MKKSCAIGCAVLLLVTAALVGVVMTKAPHWWAKGKKFVLDTMAEEQRISAFETTWAPPPMHETASWAPPTVGEWRLKQSESVTGWPELKVDRAGWRVIYEQGARTVEIGAVPANELERPELLKRLTEAAQARAEMISRKTIGSGSVTLNTSSGHMTTSMGNRTHVQAGGEHLRIWWLKDWLFFFRATDADPAAFAEEYLRAISAQGRPELL